MDIRKKFGLVFFVVVIFAQRGDGMFLVVSDDADLLQKGTDCPVIIWGRSTLRLVEQRT